jgi:flagellar assembly protein FliH
MERFKPLKPGVTQEQASVGVQPFEFPALRAQGQHDYPTLKAKCGPLAVTDPDRGVKNRKDARFALNPLVRDPLAIEEEERRAIEERVVKRVEMVEKEAKAAATEAGYKDGLKKGRDEAFAKFNKDAEARLTKFDGLLAEFENAKTQIFKANERFVLEMISRISRMVLLRELKTDKEYLLRLTRELIERVGVRDHITIRFNPDDMQTVATLKNDLEQTLGALKNLNIEASAGVRLGGCELETQWNAIDASVETQLQGIYDALTDGKGSASA